MSLRFAPFAALWLLLDLTLAVTGDEKTPTSELYPVKVGTVWRYRSSGSKILVRVAKHEKVGDATCAVLETLVEGKVVATEYVAAQADGLYRYAIDGKKADSAIRFLKLPATKGNAWEAAIRIAGQTINVTLETDEEEVKVLAGKFQAVVTRTRDFEVAGQKLSEKVWYARNVGMVRTEMTIAGNTTLIELEKYEPAK